MYICLCIVFVFLPVLLSGRFDDNYAARVVGRTNPLQSLCRSGTNNIVLLLIQVGVVRLFQRMRLAWAFTFIPSTLLLAMITDVSQSGVASNGFIEFGWGGYVLPLCLISYFVVVWLLNTSGMAEKYSHVFMDQTRQLWVSLSVMLLMMLFVCGWGNSDRVFHDRIHVEQCLVDNDVDEALRTLQQHSDADENLTMLTAYTLSRKGLLAE